MTTIRDVQDKRRARAGVSRKAGPMASADETPYFEPSAQQVARRAYSIYVDQGFLDGNAVNHWVNAEAQLVIEHHHAHVLG